jgi:glycosyltransferase involved in cell wall biosynthesis
LVLSKVTEAHGPGGMQRHLSLLLEWLTATGIDVTLLTTSGGVLPPRPRLRSIALAGSTPARYSRSWWRGTRRFAQESPSAWDVIVSEDGGAWAVIDELRRKPARPPTVMFRHGTTLLNFRQLVPPRQLRDIAAAAIALRDYWRHPRRLARWVDLMIAPTDRIAASAREEGAGAQIALRVIPLGVDLARFSPAANVPLERKALGLDPAIPVVSWVGRDVPGKRLRLVLTVFQRLAVEMPLQLAIAVAAPRPGTRAQIEAIRARDPGRVAVLADASDDRVLAVHRAASFQLFPSALAEGVPFAILESLACGSPVLATPSPSLRDLHVFRDQPDWIVADDRVEGWIMKARGMLAPGVLATASLHARTLAQQYYDLSDTERRSIAAITEVVKAWPGRRSR